MRRNSRAGKLRSGVLALLVAAGALAAVPAPTALPNLPPNFDAATLVAVPTLALPSIDGALDGVWSGARPLEVTAAGGSGNFPPGSGIQVKALYDSASLYLLIEWADPTEDFAKAAWLLTDNSTPEGNWSRQPWGEDAMSLILDDGQGLEQNFSSFGCGALCHTGGLQEMRTDGAGTVDVWHWSSALTHPFGYADDLYLDNQSKANGSVWGGFHGDGPDRAAENLATTAFGDRPAYLNGTVPLGESARYVGDADKAPINWTTFDSVSLANGTRVPGFVLSAPSAARGEVRAGAVHTGTGWRLELARPLVTTDNASRDLSFDDLNATYFWSLSLNNNQTGDNASRAGILYKLIFADNTLPDLTPESVIKASPFTVIGDPVDLTLRALNLGFGATSGPVFAAVRDESNVTEVANVTVPIISSGDLFLANITFPSGPYPAGAHNFTARLDTADSELESFEDNNTLAFQVTFVTVVSPPDLAVLSAEGPPGVVFSGEPFTLNGTVANNGPGDSVADVVLRAEHPALAPIYLNVGPLLANETASYAFIFNSTGLAGGSYAFTITADPNDTIAESDESVSSNSRPVLVEIDDRPDLVAAGIAADPPSGLEGDALNLTLTVQNRGAAYSGTVEVWLYLDNASSTGPVGRTGNWTVPVALPFNASANSSANWTLPAGLGFTTHFLRAWVDATDVVGESSEANNNATVQILVLEPQRPNLVVTGLVLGASEYRAGDTASASIEVRNLGVDYAGAVRLEVIEATQNRSLGNITVPAVGAGLASNFSLTFTVPAGTPGQHSVLAVVDADNTTNEGKYELDNAASVNYTLLAPAVADLVLSQMDFQPPLPALGSLVTLIAVVSNQGTAASPATTVSFAWGATPIGTAPVPALGPGQTFTASLTWNTSSVRSLAALVGATVQAPPASDANLSNNVASIQIGFTQPGQPSFRLGSAKVAPASAAVGETVRLEVFVSNNGTAAGEAVLRFLLDGVEFSRLNLSLAPGAGETRSATFVAAGPGTHRAGVELQLQGLAVKASSVTLTVSGPAAPGEPPYAALGLLAAVVIVLLSLALLRRPPAPPEEDEPPAEGGSGGAAQPSETKAEAARSNEAAAPEGGGPETARDEAN